jgi:hypothetical protein
VVHVAASRDLPVGSQTDYPLVVRVPLDWQDDDWESDLPDWPRPLGRCRSQNSQAGTLGGVAVDLPWSADAPAL